VAYKYPADVHHLSKCCQYIMASTYGLRNSGTYMLASTYGGLRNSDTNDLHCDLQSVEYIWRIYLKHIGIIKNRGIDDICLDLLKRACLSECLNCTSSALT
jgi:hypothetical protein